MLTVLRVLGAVILAVLAALAMSMGALMAVHGEVARGLATAAAAGGPVYVLLVRRRSTGTRW